MARQPSSGPASGQVRLGLLANGDVPGMRETYEASCRCSMDTNRGLRLLPEQDTLSAASSPTTSTRDWDELGEYLLHDARSYADWNPDNDASAGISCASDVAELRDTSKSHLIIATASGPSNIVGRRATEPLAAVRRCAAGHSRGPI